MHSMVEAGWTDDGRGVLVHGQRRDAVGCAVWNAGGGRAADDRAAELREGCDGAVPGGDDLTDGEWRSAGGAPAR